MTRKPRIYIAGPYTKGDVAVNVRNAIVTADRLTEHGFAPYIPHLVHFWHLICPHDYDFWTDLDNQFLPVCDALLLLPGESPGAEAEAQLARKLDIPVFTNIGDLLARFSRD